MKGTGQQPHTSTSTGTHGHGHGWDTMGSAASQLFLLFDFGISVPVALGIMSEPSFGGQARILAWVGTYFLVAAAGPSLINRSGRVPGLHVFVGTCCIAAVFAVSAMVSVMTESVMVKFLFGMASVKNVLRVTEIVLHSEDFLKRAAVFRISFVFQYHDIRQCRQIEQENTADASNGKEKWHVDTSLKLKVATFHVLKFLGLFGSSVACHFAAEFLNRAFDTTWSMFPTASYWCTRWFLGTARFALFVRAVDAGYRIHLAVFGMTAPACFLSPELKSKSLREFWSLRWNLAIQKLLHDSCYKPFAKYGYRRVAFVATFLGSAAYHILPFLLVGASSRTLLHMSAFFLLQIPLCILEHRWKMKGRAWFVTAIVPLIPLFVEPTFSLI